jgi:3D (Asp-Asp-Asp) domain-containing protein
LLHFRPDTVESFLVRIRTKSCNCGETLWYGPRLVRLSRPWIAACAACAALASTVPAGASPPLATLHAQARHALLSLYAIDTQLHTAQARHATLVAEETQLQHDDAALSLQLAATRHTLTVARERLNENLRLLYKQDDLSALAVVLGAASLDDAVTQLDSLGHVAEQSRSLLGTARRAQTRVARLRRTLHARRLRVAADAAAAAQAARTLLSARAGRLELLARLRTQERVRVQELQALQQVAQRVERKSIAIQAAAPAPAPAVSGAHTLTVTTTGYSLAGHTSTGMPVAAGVVAVDPSVIPLGTRLTIPGYGEAVAADTGGGVHGAMIDLWFPTLAQARAWGRRTVTVTLH